MATPKSSQKTLTIHTGFEKIHYEHLGLQKSSLERGKALFDSNHIINMKEVRKSGSGFCIRQASVTERAYGIFLKLDDQRKIIPGSLANVIMG